MIGFIFILTILDAILTVTGVRADVVEEGNPLGKQFFDWNPVVSCVIIVIVVGLLLALISKYRKKIKWLDSVLYLVVGIKILVMFFHMNWIMGVS